MDVQILLKKHKKIQVLRWLKPAPSRLKLNLDGSGLGNPGPAGGGGVLRDSSVLSNPIVFPTKPIAFRCRCNSSPTWLPPQLIVDLVAVTCVHRRTGHKLAYSFNYSYILYPLTENNYQLFMVERIILMGAKTFIKTYKEDDNNLSLTDDPKKNTKNRQILVFFHSLHDSDDTGFLWHDSNVTIHSYCKSKSCSFMRESKIMRGNEASMVANVNCGQIHYTGCM
ncbi:hypothetical protein LWI29_008632 [Acer saccharum]|uniref:Uncharacterized protein n=1 Tax=Acer saccharum TaxID=4024 RepID=A0AA39RK67_ACESA|nr:hypothetical protein LWI29_008632 [Acer saccharum]